MTERSDEELGAETGSARESDPAGDVLPPVPPVGSLPGGAGSLDGLPQGSRTGGFGQFAGADAGLRAGRPLGPSGRGGAGMGAGGMGGVGAGQFVVALSSPPPLTDGVRVIQRRGLMGKDLSEDAPANVRSDKPVGWLLPWDSEDDEVLRDSVPGDGLAVSPPVIGED